jgi:hypothetical protein
MADVLKRRPSKGNGNSMIILVEELTETQKETIPEDKQPQFLKLSGATQTMIRDIKYILHSMVNQMKGSVHHTEIMSTARLISKIKKVNWKKRII